VTVVSSKYDLNTQVGQIENFIANKVDMIVLNAADSKGVGPAVKKAKGRHRRGGRGRGRRGADVTVMSDNTMAGAESCKFIADKLQGKGNVVIVNGPPVSAVMDRVTGCKAEFKKSPGIKILSDNQNAGGSRDGGMTTMSNLLAAHGKIDGVFAINDPTASVPNWRSARPSAATSRSSVVSMARPMPSARSRTASRSSPPRRPRTRMAWPPRAWPSAIRS
jgi:ribose transport system substrate-binding protein